MERQDLITGGWNQYKDYFNTYADESWQLRVKDERGTKYFINCKLYYKNEDKFIEDSFEFECQFNTMSDNKKTFNVTLLNDKRTLEEAKSFFEDMFQKMNCDYYEEY